MIVVVHQLFIITQAFARWLWQNKFSQRRKKIDYEDEVDSEIIRLDENDKTIQFPFFFDQKTISHIKGSKTMFIMRGVSGCGKSTLVGLICKIYKDVRVCSADQYFMKNGEYQFDHTLLSIAHEKCGEKAKKACMNGVPVIVIDNTNVRRWEMTTYLNLAVSYNYTVIILKPKTEWSHDPEKLAERNKHGVTADIIQSKLRIFEEVHPLYYGWFLNEQHSRILYNLGKTCLEECVGMFPKFKDLLIFQSPDLFQEIEKEVQDCIIKCKEWYGWHFPELKTLISNDLIYARTVHKIGHRRNSESVNLSGILPKQVAHDVRYHAKMSMGAEISDEDIVLISDLCEQIIELTEYKDLLEEFMKNPMARNPPKMTAHVGEVIGLLLMTNADQFEETMIDHYNLNKSRRLHCTAKFMGTKKNPNRSSTYPYMEAVQRSYGKVFNLTITKITVTSRTIGAKVNLSPICLELYDKPQEREVIRKSMGNTSGIEKGSLAHITIGTAPGIPPVQTNDDLLDIIDAEYNSNQNNVEILNHNCDFGTIQYVGKDLYVIDLKDPVVVQGLFSGFYGGQCGSPVKR